MLVLGNSITNFDHLKILGDVDENVKMLDMKEIDCKDNNYMSFVVVS